MNPNFGCGNHWPVATVQHTDSRATDRGVGAAPSYVSNYMKDKELGVITDPLCRISRKAPHLHFRSRRVDARSGQLTSKFATHSENTTGMQSLLSGRLPKNFEMSGSTEC